MENSIYHYTNQSKYLRDLKQWHASSGEEISYQELADSIPSMTRSRVKKFFQGKGQLSKNIQRELLTNMKLSTKEQSFFELLQKFNDVKDAEIAYGMYKKIVETRSEMVNTKTQELDRVQLKLYEHWSTLPLLYYFDIKNCSIEPEMIFNAFKRKISLEQINIGINTLKELNLITIENSRVIKNVDSTSILDGVPRPLIKKFHLEMLTIATDSVYKLPQDKRFLMGLTVAVDSEVIPIIKERITAFFTQMNAEFSSENADSLYQMSLQFHNLATIDKEQESSIKH